jgi:hypothetical protein
MSPLQYVVELLYVSKFIPYRVFQCCVCGKVRRNGFRFAYISYLVLQSQGKKQSIKRSRASNSHSEATYLADRE